METLVLKNAKVLFPAVCETILNTFSGEMVHTLKVQPSEDDMQILYDIAIDNGLNIEKKSSPIKQDALTCRIFDRLDSEFMVGFESDRELKGAYVNLVVEYQPFNYKGSKSVRFVLKAIRKVADAREIDYLGMLK